MDIYLKLEDAKGDVDALGFEGAIKVDSMDFSVDSYSSQEESSPYGGANAGSIDPSRSPTKLSGITLIKRVDSASTALFKMSCNCSGKYAKGVISFVQQGSTEKGEEFIQYTLERIGIGHYSISSKGDFPIETINLSFRRITFKYTHYDKDGNKVSLMRSGYDVDKAQII